MQYVEIKGIGFPNKGADLLLCAVLEQLKKRGLTACMEPYSPYKYKLDYPIITKTSIYMCGVNILYPLNILPKYVKQRLGFVSPSKVDLVLDASGFAYGDDWPRSIAKSRILSGKKTTTILLPQSLGPFYKKRSIKTANQISKRAKLIFSREQEGIKHFFSATGIEANYCPDITFIYKPKKTEDSAEVPTDVLIIPNFQVYLREGETYLINLSKIIFSILSLNRKVTFLNHEGEKDNNICETISQRVLKEKGIKINTLCPTTGVEAKQLISRANLVFTSRYHGLISALSQQIPVACYGWSFKYRAIMNRFELPTIDLANPKEEDIDFLLSQDYSGRFLSLSYKEELKKIKQEINQMWDVVFS